MSRRSPGRSSNFIVAQRNESPDLFDALEVDVALADLGKTLTLEMAPRLGENIIPAAISIAATNEFLVRGAEVTDTGNPVVVPADRWIRQGPHVQRPR